MTVYRGRYKSLDWFQRLLLTYRWKCWEAQEGEIKPPEPLRIPDSRA
jgi:hypothetical protein